jgi:uncharacterized protein YkwD
VLLLGVVLLTVLVACAPSTPEALLPTVAPEESVSPTLAPSPTGEITESIAETDAARAPTPTVLVEGVSTEPEAGAAQGEETAARTSHTVQPGETLLGLAMQYELPMAALQLTNELGASTNLWADQILTIPPAEAWAGASPFWIVYEIQEGDTLTGITERYDLDFVGLVAVNELTDADALSVGQPLILPLEAPTEVALTSASEPVAAAPPEPATATPEPVAEVAEAVPEAPATAPPTPLPPVSAPAEIAGWPGEVFRLINEQRAAAGLPPYTWNDTLALAAQRHGADCQQRGSCNHTGSDGSTVKIRVTRAGYPTVGAAECIVYSSSPAEAVAWWMDEVPPNDWHRRTLLSTWVTEVGIAVVPNHLGSYYFIADFGRPQ